jgi:hypothetical protein
MNAFSSKLLRIGLVVALAIGTLLVDGAAVALLWAEGVDFATLDRELPNGSGFQIKPLTTGYKWLLGALLAVNIGLFLYLLSKQQRWYALGFVMGAAAPMAYLVAILVSAGGSI